MLRASEAPASLPSAHRWGSQGYGANQEKSPEDVCAKWRLQASRASPSVPPLSKLGLGSSACLRAFASAVPPAGAPSPDLCRAACAISQVPLRSPLSRKVNGDPKNTTSTSLSHPETIMPICLGHCPLAGVSPRGQDCLVLSRVKRAL